MTWRIELRKALFSLPWYLAVPTISVGAICLFVYFLLPEVGKGLWETTKAAFVVGAFAWLLRQIVRLWVTVAFR